MLRQYWKELTAAAITLACTSYLIYGYYTAVLNAINTLPGTAVEEQTVRNGYSKRAVLTPPQREELEYILANFNKEVFIGKEPSFVPLSLLLEDEKTLDCRTSYVYFELAEGFAKYEYYHPQKLKKRKEIGSVCWTIEYTLQFPSNMKAIFNREGELQDFETTCHGKKEFNLQKQVGILPQCDL